MPLVPQDSALDLMTLLYIFSGLSQPFTWDFQGLEVKSNSIIEPEPSLLLRSVELTEHVD